MMPKHTMMIVVDTLVKMKVNERSELDVEIRARELADEHCIMMDKRLESSLRAALGNKHIGIARQDLIINTFCDLMLEVPDENISK